MNRAKRLQSVFLSFVFATWFGCATPSAPNQEVALSAEPVDSSIALRPTEQPPFAARAPAPLELALGTSDGEWAIVQTSDGQIISSIPNQGLGGDLDITFDLTRNELLSFEGDDQYEGGEIWAYPIDDGALQLPVQRGWVDGSARLLATPFGLIRFTQSMGDRWELDASNGSIVPSISLSSPSSVAATEPSNAFELVALASSFPDGDAWSREQVSVLGAGLVSPVSAAVELGLSSAQLVVSEGEEVAVGVSDGRLALQIVSADADSLATEALADGVLAARAIDTSTSRLIVALVGQPARLVCISLTYGAVSLAVKGVGEVLLPGEVTFDETSISRSLQVSGALLFAATSVGVFAFDIDEAEAQPCLRPRSFAGDPLQPNPLRPPIVVLGSVSGGGSEKTPSN